MGSSTDNPATHIQHGLLGFGNHLRGNLDLLGVCLGHRVVSGKVNFWGPNKRRALLLRILRDVHEHRSWPTGRCDVHRGSNDARNFFRLRHQERVLGDRHGDTRDVDFLERVCSHRRRENLTGDGEQGNRVHVCISDCRHQVGGSWPRGGNRDAELAGCRRIPFRSMAGALFVSNQDVSNLVGRHEFVVERHDGSARQTKDVFDSQQLERFKDGS